MGALQRKHWKKWKKGIVKAGLTDYKKGHTSDAFLISLYFDNLTGDNDQIGFFVTLPNSATAATPDVTGFYFAWNLAATKYESISYFI